jgi:hypothetical protein
VGLEPGTPCGAAIEGLAPSLRSPHAISDARLSALVAPVYGVPLSDGIGMKRSVDSVHECDSFVWFGQTLTQALCRGTSFSRGFEHQPFCRGTGALEKAAQLDLRLKESLHPPLG